MAFTNGDFVFFMHMVISPACVYVHHACAVSTEARREHQSLELEL